MTVLGETIPTAELAEARQAVYRFFLAALDKPSAAQHAWFGSPEFRRTLELLGAEFNLALPEEDFPANDPADHEARYIACFEAGLPEPPVPLEPEPKAFAEQHLAHHGWRAGRHA